MKEGFKKLIVWEKAYKLALDIYVVTKKFPKDEIYGLVSQMRRASVSISANIAEGYERQYRKEYIQFLMIAKGSLGELETYLLFSRDLDYLKEEEYNNLDIKRQEVGKLLRGLIKAMQS